MFMVSVGGLRGWRMGAAVRWTGQRRTARPPWSAVYPHPRGLAQEARPGQAEGPQRPSLDAVPFNARVERGLQLSRRDRDAAEACLVIGEDLGAIRSLIGASTEK